MVRSEETGKGAMEEDKAGLESLGEWTESRPKPTGDGEPARSGGPGWGRTGVTISRHRVWNQIIAPRRTTACLFGSGYPAHTIEVVRGSLQSAGFASAMLTLHPSAASLRDFSVIGPMQICPPVLGILPLESLCG